MTERAVRAVEAVRYAPTPAEVGATVTVVIPSFNYARYLPEAVRSVLDQRDVVVDVVIVDDASSDDSLAVASALAAADSRVRVLANRRNRGPVATFNRGLAAARGEFLVLLDADDLLTPGSLSRSVSVLQRFGEVGFVYGHPLHFTDERSPARTDVTSVTVWSGRDWLEARCAAGDNVITSPEVVIRRSVLDTVGGQRELAHTHDMELWLRIAAHADVAHLDGCDQAWHRDHPVSLSTQAEEPGVILREIRDAFETVCDGLEPDPEAARLRRTARRAVSLNALGQARRYVDRGEVTLEAENLRQFALELYPPVFETTQGRRFAAAYRRATRWPRPAARAVGVAPRVMRRLHVTAAWVRWQHTGVYERARIMPAQVPCEPPITRTAGTTP